jgi:hypothetical protein
MAHRPALPLPPILGAVLLLAALISCGQSTGPEEQQLGPYTEVVCTGLTLSSTTGTTLDRIPIGSLPSSFDPPFAAALLDSDDKPVGLAYVREDESGTLNLHVPLHPSDPLEGGPVRLALTDGTRACAPVDLSIEPLPAAEGELAAVVDLLAAEVDAQAAVFGATGDELRTAPFDDLDPSLWPLAMAQAVIDGADNDGSLRAIADGGLGADVLDWTDRLLARTGLLEHLSAPPPARVLGAATAPVASPSRSVEGLLCQPDYVDTGAQLDFCMEKAAEIAASVTGISREVSEDIKQVFADLDSNNLPLAGEVKVIFSAMFWVIYTQREQAASLLPSQFTAMEAEADPQELREDDEAQVSLRATVYATSLGYNLQDQIIDGLKEAVSLVETTGKFDFSTGTALDDAAGKLAPHVESRLRDIDIDALDLPAELFGPVTLVENDLLDSRIVSGDALSYVDDVTYEGHLRGPSTISVRTQDGSFGGTQIADQLDFEVTPLQVGISPTVAYMGADEVRTFDVTVSASKFTQEIELFDTEALQGMAELTLGEGGSHYVTYVAPANPNPQQVDLIKVRHTSTAGARAASEEVRSAVAEVRFGRLYVTVDKPCIEPGETVQFTASFDGNEGVAVTWSASVGDIDENGLYTAPDEPASIVVTATLASNPDIQATRGLQIGGCSCSVSFTLSGVPSTATDGLPNFSLTEGRTGITGLNWVGSLTAVSLGFGPDPYVPTPMPVGQTGGYPVIVQGVMPSVGSFHSHFTPDGDVVEGASLNANITRNEGGNVLEGSVNGSVVLWTDEQPTVGFTLDFIITADEGLSDATRSRCLMDGG